MVRGEEIMSPKIQELSDKVLLVTLDPLVNEDAKNLLGNQLESFGFRVIWMVG